MTRRTNLAINSRTNGRVLLVEEKPSLGKQLASALGRHGWSVTGAQDAASAIELLESGEYDFVITDLGTPDLIGAAFIDCVRSRWRDVPILVMTGSTSPSLRRSILRKGVVFYLAKPVDPQRLNEALQSLVDERLWPAFEPHTVPPPPLQRDIRIGRHSNMTPYRDHTARLP